MDITSDVTYRTLLLTGAKADAGGGDNPISGYRLTRARISDVQVEGYMEKRSLDDGMDASDVYLGQRLVTLTGEVYAASKGGLFDALDLLRLKFTPTDAYNQAPRDRGFLPMAFSQPTLFLVHWPSGRIDREIRVRPAGQPEYDIQFAATHGEKVGGLTGGFVVPFTVRGIAKDPRFYGVSDITHMLTGGSATAQTASLRNRGNYPAPLNLILAATSAGKKTFTLDGLGSNMTVTIPDIAGNRQVQVDGINKVVTLTTGGTESLRMDLITFAAGYTWPRVKPTPEGTPDVTFLWTGAGIIDTSKAFFREAWA